MPPALRHLEQKSKEQQVQIADLGSKLNSAWPPRSRSWRAIAPSSSAACARRWGSREDIRIVGDRFVFQSEVLFASGSAEIGHGRPRPARHAGDHADPDHARKSRTTSTGCSASDGHTDKRPITQQPLSIELELSTARAIAVVKYLASKGIPENKLAAARLRRVQPTRSGDSEDAYTKNRRIEFKLDQR